jgi:hypothetical protein
MFVSAERYKKLLMASGVDEARASEIASRVPAQGVMVAIKFKAPQAVRHPDGKMAQTGAVTAHGAFFHFTQALRPEMDSLGIALIQPIPYEAMTYLKGIVPGVLRGTRVAAPAGFTWSMEDTRQAAAEARARLYQEFGAMPTDEQVEQEVKKSIRQKLWAMLEKYPYVTEIIEKPEKESGGRGA